MQKLGHFYSKREEEVWPLLFLNNNEPVFFAPCFLQPTFLNLFFSGSQTDQFFQNSGCRWNPLLLSCFLGFLAFAFSISYLYEKKLRILKILSQYEYFFSIYRWNRPIILSYWMLGYILAISSQDLIKSPSPNFIMLALWTQVTFKSKSRETKGTRY